MGSQHYGPMRMESGLWGTVVTEATGLRGPCQTPRENVETGDRLGHVRAS